MLNLAIHYDKSFGIRKHGRHWGKSVRSEEQHSKAPDSYFMAFLTPRNAVQRHYFAILKARR
jgi:hypothetical protein